MIDHTPFITATSAPHTGLEEMLKRVELNLVELEASRELVAANCPRGFSYIFRPISTSNYLLKLFRVRLAVINTFLSRAHKRGTECLLSI